MKEVVYLVGIEIRTEGGILGPGSNEKRITTLFTQTIQFPSFSLSSRALYRCNVGNLSRPQTLLSFQCERVVGYESSMPPCHQLLVTLHSTKYLRQIPPDLSTQTSTVDSG